MNYEWWTVLRERGSVLVGRFTAECDAKGEAERLAGICPGEAFYILRAVSRSYVAAAVTVKLEEMPF